MHHTDTRGFSDVKGYASMQMVGAGVTLFTSVTSALANCVISAISAISMYAVWALFGMIVFSILFILQESYAHLLVDALDQYNSTYGPVIHKIALIPLQVGIAAANYCLREQECMA
jgi:hypothetical protein